VSSAASCASSPGRAHARSSLRESARFVERPNEAALKSLLQQFVKDKAVACEEIWAAARQDELPLSEEERLRGGDRRIEACLVIDTLRAQDADRVASALFNQFPTRLPRTCPA
jgi:hypothetical protein